MKLLLISILLLPVLSSLAQSEDFCYSDNNYNQICVDTLSIPKELIPFFSLKGFQWENAAENCETFSINVVEVKRLRRNKKYRFRVLTSCKTIPGGATSTGGLVYIFSLQKLENGGFKVASKKYLYMEI